jgi:hypothetical protein
MKASRSSLETLPDHARRKGESQAAIRTAGAVTAAGVMGVRGTGSDDAYVMFCPNFKSFSQ